MNRRGFLGAILASGVAPYVVRSGILMPVRVIQIPEIVTGQSLLMEGAPVLTSEMIRAVVNRMRENNSGLEFYEFVNPEFMHG